MTLRLREVNSWLKMHRLPPPISNSKSNRNNLPKRTITKKITRLHHKAVETKIKIMTIIDGINNSLPVAEDVMDEAALTSRMTLLETATIIIRNAAAEATIEVVVVVGVAITRASSRISSEGIDVEVAMVVVVAEAVVATQMTTNART